MKKILLLSVLCLAGCRDELTTSYLMQHPLVLKKEVTYCQQLGDKTPDQVAQCKRVMQVAQDLTALIEEEQQDPEKFGEKMLKLQMGNANNANQEQILIMQGVLGLSSPE